jgi:hypothetical protein
MRLGGIMKDSALRLVAGTASTALLSLAFVSTTAADVWVLTSQRLQRLAPNGTALVSVNEAFDRRISGADMIGGELEVDERDGTVWLFDQSIEPLPVPQFDVARMLKVSPDGVPLLQRKMLDARGLAIDAGRGGVWVSKVTGRTDPTLPPPSGVPRQLVLYDEDTGEPIAAIDGFRRQVWSIEVGADGALWVNDLGDGNNGWTRLTGTVEELDGYDVSTGSSGPHHERIDFGFRTSSPISINPSDGTVWMGKHVLGPAGTSATAGHVLKLSPEGELLLTVLPDGFESIYELSVNSRDGSFWVTDNDLSEGSQPRGAYIAHFSQLGAELGRASAFIDYIMDITVDMTDEAAWASVQFDFQEGIGDHALLKLGVDTEPVLRIDYTEPLIAIAGYVGTAELRLSLDIAPADKQNRLNPASREGVNVALLSSATVDPLQADVSTLRFGRARAKAKAHWTRDVNRDGITDLVAMFRISDAGIRCGNRQIALRGKTYSGSTLFGRDRVITVGCVVP